MLSIPFRIPVHPSGPYPVWQLIFQFLSGFQRGKTPPTQMAKVVSLSIPFRIPELTRAILTFYSSSLSFNSFPDSSRQEIRLDSAEEGGLSIPFRIPDEK